MERIGRIHRLYVAAPLNEVAGIVAKRAKSFTLLSEEGYFCGEREPMVVVELATDDVESVIAIGQTLRHEFEQDGVGYAVDGVHYRIAD